MRKWIVPIVLGVVTCLLLVAVLWKPEAPKRQVVVAARDLGAGVALIPSDLTTVTMPGDQAPADGVTDPGKLVGQTLAVVRFAGEPITLKHLGPAVDLKADERGVAVKVRADTGLAGLLRPGMTVGVVATLRVSPPAVTDDAIPHMQGNAVYAKLLLEGLRVVYVSPDFQARPDVPVTLQATIQGGKASSGAVGGGLFGGSAPASASQGSSDQSSAPKEGVVLLAAGTKPQQVLYVPPTDEAMVVFGGVPLAASLPVTVTGKAGKVTPKVDSALRWIVPAEMLAALNSADALTLVMMPQSATEAGTPGLLLSDLMVDNQPRSQGGVK